MRLHSRHYQHPRRIWVRFHHNAAATNHHFPSLEVLQLFIMAERRRVSALWVMFFRRKVSCTAIDAFRSGATNVFQGAEHMVECPNPSPTSTTGAHARAQNGARACTSAPDPTMTELPPPAEIEMRAPPGITTSCVRTLSRSGRLRGGRSGLTRNTGALTAPPPSPSRVGRWGIGGRMSPSSPSRSPPPS